MGTMTVEMIAVTALDRISVDGGDVLHAIKRVDPGFIDFGEAYFSGINVGYVKAWKRHLAMTLNIVVPVGSVQFVFVDELGGIREEIIGTEVGRYVRLTVPPGIWFGFKGLFSPRSILMNVADIPHEPHEVERLAVNSFNFDWGAKK